MGACRRFSVLLQARPITALPRPPRLEPLAEGFWQKDAMHLRCR